MEVMGLDSGKAMGRRDRVGPKRSGPAIPHNLASLLELGKYLIFLLGHPDKGGPLGQLFQT